MIRKIADLSPKSVIRYVAGFVALAVVAATCKDLTGPTGIATNGSAVTVRYMGPRDANGVVQLTVGDRVSPAVEVRIGGAVATRARYFFSTKNDSVLTVVGNGDTLVATGRGRDTIIVTLAGVTIGGKVDPNTIQMVDRVPVAVKPARNLVTTTPIPVLRSLGDTAVIAAESQDITGARARAGKVRWYTSNPTILTVDSVGFANADSSNSSPVVAVNNGVANLVTVFDDVDTVRTAMTVQQQISKWVIGSRFGINAPIDFRSLGDTATIRGLPRDARDSTLRAGAIPPPVPSYSISSIGRVSLNPATGLLTANANTDVGAPVTVTTSGGGLTSAPVPVAVQQVATSIAIVGKRVDTIPSIGSTKDLIAIVRDARGNDVQTAITWTSRNTTVAQFRTSTAGDIALAIDTGTTRFVVSRDQVSDSITITVTNSPETVVLAPDTLYLRSISEVKRFTTLTVKNAKGDALVNIPVTWTSADPSIVQARADSTMRAVAVGATNVTARTPNGKTATSRVIVTNAPAFLDILPANSTLGSVGDTLLNIAVDFRNGLGVAVPRSAASWGSSDVNVATVSVDPSGNVRIIAAATGNAYIRAVSPVDPLVRDSVFVTVTNAPTSIVAAPSPAPTLAAFGATISFTATVLNAKGDPIPTAKVRWSVPAGNAFVSIDSITGVATALSNGSATVRATSNGIIADVPVTVAQAIAGTRSTITPGVATLVADGTSSTTVTVQLKDANDNNIAFGSSSIVLSSSLGTLAPLPPTDNGNGRYTTTLTTGTTTGSASITGTANGSAITNSGLVAFTAGAASKFIVTPNNFTPAAGSAVTVRAQLADANNNPITAAGTVVQFTSTNGGTFTPGSGQASTNVAGVATITFNTSTTVGSHTITATTGAINGSSAAITSVAGTATQYIVTPSSTSPAAGSVIQVFAQLADANNNVVAQTGQSVSWSHTGTGAFPGGATDNSLTNSSGVATINFTTSTTSGQAATVTATTGALTGTSQAITTIAGAGAQLGITQLPPANPQSGVAFGPQPSIQLRDAAGNIVSLANINVTVMITAGGGTLGGVATVQTNAGGLATFTDLMITGAVGPRTLTFLASGFAATGTGVSLVPGPASTVTTTIEASPASVAADGTSTSTVTVQAKDSFGNILTTEADAVTLSAAPGGALAVVPGVAGTGRYTATLPASNSMGLVTVTGTMNGNPIVDDATVARVAGAATNYLVTPTAGTLVVGSGMLITAQLRDASNNLVAQAGKTIVWSNPEAGGNFTPATSTTDQNGRAQILYTATAPGSQTIGATDNTGLTGSTSVSNSNPVPTLTSLSPAFGNRLQTLDVILNGSGYMSGITTVNLGPDIIVNSVTFNSSTQLTADITIPDITATGARSFSVTNNVPGGGTSGTQPFTVNNPSASIGSMSTTSAVRGETLDVVLTGTNFITGATSVGFSPGTDITINSTTVNSPTQMTVNVTVGTTAATGGRNFRATNAGPGGGSSGNQNFSINAPALPTLASVSPSIGALSETLVLTFTGTNFYNGVTSVTAANVGAGITVNSVTVLSATQLAASITVTNVAAVGARSFSVTNTPAGGPSNTQTFTVNYPAPTLGNLAPATGTRLQMLNVVFTGTGFISGVSSVDVGANIVVNSTTVDSPTQITANISVDAAAAIGLRNFSVTNSGPGGGTSSTLSFNVTNPVPTLTSIAPALGDRLQTMDVVFTGTGFIAGVSTVDVGGNITVNSTTVDSPTQITANVTITAAAALGARSFTVINSPAGGTSGAQTFTVNNPAPSISGISPNPAGVGALGGTVTTTVLTGTGFVTGETVVDFTTGATIGGFTIDSPTQITVTNINYPALGITQTIRVTNTGRPQATLTYSQ